jgi:hypothetical protein
MYNVPPKFNQICRLCLTFVEPKGTVDGDEIVKKLSIFNSHGQQQNNSHKNNYDKKSNEFNVRDDVQLNKKIKRSNEISISLSGGSGSAINNGFSDDDSDGDIAERILECLSIKVSHFICILSVLYARKIV